MYLKIGSIICANKLSSLNLLILNQNYNRLFYERSEALGVFADVPEAEASVLVWPDSIAMLKSKSSGCCAVF